MNTFLILCGIVHIISHIIGFLFAYELDCKGYGYIVNLLVVNCVLSGVVPAVIFIFGIAHVS